MAKIGIVCDNYKLDKFKQELDKRGIVYNVEGRFTEDTVIITCFSEQSIVQPIIEAVSMYFVDKATKNN